MKTRAASVGFLVSVVLHATLVWFLFGPAPDARTPELIQVEYFESEAQFVKAAPSQVGTSQGQKKGRSPRNLFPSSWPTGKQNLPQPTLNTGVGVLDDNQQYNEAMTDIFGDNAEWAFLQYLHQKVEEELSFDRKLAEWNHFGTVYVEFWVDDRGQLLPNKFRVVADDPILKVHSLRAIRRGLAEPFEDTKWNRSKESVKIQAKFDYRFGAENGEKQRVFSKRALVFQRRTLVKRIPTDFWQQMGEGGINTDLVVMYNKWKQFNKKKKQLYIGWDPFEDYRKDPDYNL